LAANSALLARAFGFLAKYIVVYPVASAMSDNTLYGSTPYMLAAIATNFAKLPLKFDDIP
jgi:biotin transporter BioY